MVDRERELLAGDQDEEAYRSNKKNRDSASDEAKRAANAKAKVRMAKLQGDEKCRDCRKNDKGWHYGT